MFPSGLPGLALLALRASVSLALLAECFVYRQSLSDLLLTAAIALAVVLSIGWLTPIASVIALALHGAIWCLVDVPAAGVLTVVVLDGLALSMLGPGAYSLDSYRFGRRVVVVPPP